MPILRRALAVSAVAAASTFAFALPASAHNGDFERHCGEVTMNLSQFGDGQNTVHVFRDGHEIDTFTFLGKVAHKTYVEPNVGNVSFQAKWFANETSDHNANSTKNVTLYAPKDCQPETPPTTEAPPTEAPPTSEAPTAPATTEAPTAAPSSSPAAVLPASPTPSATPSTAVQGERLANTGAGNTVPLVVIGSVLVAGGAALTIVTRRRRSTAS